MPAPMNIEVERTYKVGNETFENNSTAKLYSEVKAIKNEIADAQSRLEKLYSLCHHTEITESFVGAQRKVEEWQDEFGYSHDVYEPCEKHQCKVCGCDVFVMKDRSREIGSRW